MYLEHASYRYPTHLVPLLDLALTLLLLALLLWICRRQTPFSSAWLDRIDRVWSGARRVSRRPGRLAIALFALGVLASAAVELALGPPVPRVVDEISYLYAAETFARGDLTNPSSPHWRHFQAVHVLPEPTSQGKYPPAQAVVLALGFVFAHPSASLWLLTGLLTAATAWALRHWLPPPWPLLAALFVLLRIGIGSYWNQSFWGGSVAMIAGLLVLGGGRAQSDRPSTLRSILFGIGILLLANSRPFEGLLFTLPFVPAFAVWWFGRMARPPRHRRSMSAAVVAAVLLVGGLAMAIFHRAVTGSAFLFPHVLYSAEYLPADVVHFLWNYPFDVPWWHAGLHRGTLRLAFTAFFYGGLGGGVLGALALPTLSSRLRRDPWLLAGFSGALLVLVGQFLTKPWHVHYSAPLGGLVVLLVFLGLRKLVTGLERGGRPGRLLALAFVVSQLVFCLAQLPAHRPDSDSVIDLREATRQWLQAEPGRDLVFLCNETMQDEWMMNSPDRDGAEILWARELTVAENEALTAAYPDREVWHLALVVRESGNTVALRRTHHDGDVEFSAP